jgi:hypothetical protein
MAYVIDEDYSQLPPPPTRAEVEADLVDWRHRLTELVKQLSAWSQEIPGIDYVIAETEMLEPKMQMVGINTPFSLPLLLIDKLPTERAGPPLLRFEANRAPDYGWLSVWPDARWVIGTRGQVWLQSTEFFETLVDIGAPGAPDWRFTQHGEFLRPLTKDSFQNIIKSLR